MNTMLWLVDFIETYAKSQTVTVTPINRRRKRFGLGLQAGYGYPGGLYVGAGVSYNIFMW